MLVIARFPLAAELLLEPIALLIMAGDSIAPPAAVVVVVPALTAFCWVSGVTAVALVDAAQQAWLPQKTMHTAAAEIVKNRWMAIGSPRSQSPKRPSFPA